MEEENICKKNIDGLKKRGRQPLSVDLPMARFVSRRKNSAVWYSKHGLTEKFFTEDSKLYITPAEYARIKREERIVRASKRIDSILSRQFEKTRIFQASRSEEQYLGLKERYSSLGNYVLDLAQGSVRGVSAARMWNLSIVGAVIFGMLTMTMIYRYLGQGVSAAIEKNSGEYQQQEISRELAEEERESFFASNVIGYGESKDGAAYEIDTSYVTKLLENEDKPSEKDEFEKEILKMVKGYPIEEMVPEIVKKDRIVAAFLVAIAKKESNWGKRVPVLNGEACYNLWGYRGIRERMGTGGHTCFDSPKDAVDTVAKRMETLIKEYDRDTPSKMVVWKCGSDCNVTGGQAAADKWISDVAMYFNKLNRLEKD